MSAVSSGEKNVPCTLCATALPKSPAARGIASSAATDPAPADWPKDRDTGRVAAEGPDVVTHPLQGGDLVKQTSVGGRPLDLPETLKTHTVVERHHDDAVASQPATVVLGQSGHADR